MAREVSVQQRPQLPVEPAVEVFICHRRCSDCSPERFRAWLLVDRGNRLRALQSIVGFDAYRQLHERPRQNLLYKGLRLTRSRLVAGWLRLRRGLQPPPPAARAQRRLEAWCGVEVLRFASAGHLAASLRTAASTWQSLLKSGSHDRHIADRCMVACARTLPVTEAGVEPVEQLATLVFLRSLPNDDRLAMQRYWRDAHQVLVRNSRAALGYRSYYQYHVWPTPHRVPPWPDGVRAYDGVALVTYSSWIGFVLRFFSPKAQIANLRLVADEVGFIDEGHSVVLLADAVSIV